MLAGVDEVEGCGWEGGAEREERLDVGEGDVDWDGEGSDWEEGVSRWLFGDGGRGQLTVATEILDEDLHCLGGLGRGGAGAREGHHVVGWWW